MACPIWTQILTVEREFPKEVIIAKAIMLDPLQQSKIVIGGRKMKWSAWEKVEGFDFEHIVYEKKYRESKYS